VSRLSSVLALGATLVAGSTGPAFARGGRGGGGARAGGAGMRTGGASAGARPSAPQAAPASRPSQPAAGAAQRTAPATHSGRTGNVNASRNANATSTRTANANVNRNNVNINRGGDVNIQRNTVVRPSPVAYTRAPYRYGGRAYYAARPYAYHRYAPFAFGVGFYPFGAFVATMAATAVAVSWANTNYYYNAGAWYVPASGGYTVVTAPVGATITTLPSGAVVVNPSTNTYYYGGTYYNKTASGYTVAAPVAGTIVENLPEGGEEVTVGERKFVKIGETYYQPIEKDGKQMYEVVEVK